MKIVIASNNLHKIKEYRDILSEFDATLYSLKEAGIESDPEENGTTFQENALLKAKHAARYCKLPIIADDSGLIIDALPDILGIHTSRFLGEETPYEIKRAKVIELMQNQTNRQARFVCNIALVNFSEEDLSFQGECEGKIAFESKGNDGFGYDPIFIPSGYEKTFSELGDEKKNTLSHRKRASDLLLQYLRNQLQKKDQ